jgi:hypothetical protein
MATHPGKSNSTDELQELVTKFLDDGGKIKKLPPKEAKDIYNAGVIGSMTKK